MKKIIPLVILLAAGLAVSAGAQQPRSVVNGYFSLDFLKGPKGTPEARGSFENARAGLIFSGEWTSQFVYALELTADDRGRAGLEQAWAGLQASEAFRVRAGLFLVPFGRYNEARRPFETVLVGDPFPVGVLFPPSWRELGLVVDGRTGLLSYAAYIGNGLAEAEDLAGSQQFGDNNKDKARGARLGLGLSQSLSIGGSYYAGRTDEANGRGLTLLGADAAWQTQSIRLAGEYVQARIDNPETFAQGTAESWFAVLALRFGGWTPVVSYQSLDYRDPFHGPGFLAPDGPGAGLVRDGDRWSFGLAYAVHPNVILKLEYDRDRDRLLDRRENTLRAQAAVHF